MVVRVEGPKDHVFNIRNLLKRYGARFLPELGWHLPLDPAELNGLDAQFHLHGIESEYDGLGEFFKADSSLRERVRSDVQITHFPADAKTEPLKFQHAGIEWLVSSKRALLTDDMGLGKTLQAIYSAIELGNRIVVVCPNSLKGSWKDEIEKHLRHTKIFTAGSTKLSRVRAVEDYCMSKVGYPQFLIIHYDALRLMAEWGEKKIGAKKYVCIESLGLLGQAFAGSVLICDEGHRLKNGRTKQSMVIAAARPRNLWLLTGTPVSNVPEDVWHLVNLVRPGLLGFSWSAFEERHIERDYRGAVEGYKDLDRIGAKLALVSFGRKKSEAEDLPEKTFVQRRVDLNDEERKAYKRMLETLVAYIEENIQPGTAPTLAQAANLSARWIRLRQIADGFVSEGAGEKWEFVKQPSKISEAIEVWQDAGEPRIVVWCHFIPMVLQTAKMFQDAGAGLGRLWHLWGGVSPEQRTQAVKLWSESRGGVLVCQMDTMGEGHNMQAGNYQIFLDVPFTPRVRKQCVDRQHRIGQSNPVTIIDVLARDTVDVGLYRALSEKTELADTVEGPTFESNFMRMKREELMEALGMI